jgi:hypothetical protein
LLLNTSLYFPQSNPIEEREVGDSEYIFEGGEGEIVDQVNYEMALKRGEIEEIESDDEEEDEQEEDVGIGKLMHLCEKVERLSLKYGDYETSLDLSRSLRQFRIQLRKVETAKAKQTSLDKWFGSAGLR